MEIKLKKYYTPELTIIVNPSEWDIKFDFFNKEKVYHSNLPFRFLRGGEFSIKCKCASCERPLIIESSFLAPFEYKRTYLDVGILSPRRKSQEFINVFFQVFKKLWVNEYESTCLEGGGLAYSFYQKCPHCQVQYLATYCNIQGRLPERTDPAIPDEFYIEEIAWVEFDEEEFFREMQR